jgi:hypothetical protein
MRTILVLVVLVLGACSDNAAQPYAGDGRIKCDAIQYFDAGGFHLPTGCPFPKTKSDLEQP